MSNYIYYGMNVHDGGLSHNSAAPPYPIGISVEAIIQSSLLKERKYKYIRSKYSGVQRGRNQMIVAEKNTIHLQIYLAANENSEQRMSKNSMITPTQHTCY